MASRMWLGTLGSAANGPAEAEQCSCARPYASAPETLCSAAVSAIFCDARCYYMALTAYPPHVPDPLAGAPQAAARAEHPRPAPSPSAQQQPAESRPADPAWEDRQQRAPVASATLSEQELRLLDARMSAALASDSPPSLYEVAKAFDVLRSTRWQPSDQFLNHAAQWLDQRTAGGCSIPSEDWPGSLAWCLRTLLFSWTAFALRNVSSSKSAAFRTLPRAHCLLFAWLDSAEPGAAGAAASLCRWP